MANLTPARRIIQSEQTSFRAPVSEALAQDLGSHLNFTSFFQHNRRNFLVNGQVALAVGETALDGVFYLFKNVEIVGYAFSLDDTGIGGSTIIDVHRIDTSGVDQGSIFTTNPEIDEAAANNSATIVEFFDPDIGENVLAQPSGHTKAVFDTRNFSAGETLRFDLDASAGGTRNLTFTLIYRPID